MSVDSFEDLLDLVGNAGPWQLRTFLLSCFAGFPAALQDFLYIFIAATPDHWCHIPSSCGDYDNNEIKNLTIPLISVDGRTEYSSCSRYDVSWDKYWHNNSRICALPLQWSKRTVSCTDFDFDRTTFDSTITTEWNLVCDKKFGHTASQAVYFIGSLCGLLIFGLISDNYGRKLAVVLSALLIGVCGPIVALAPNFYVFLAARFFLSVGSPGLYDTMHVLVVESVGLKWRGMAGNASSIPYGLGYAATAVFAYWFRNWRYLQLAVTVPIILFLLMIYFVPESPRWLIVAAGNGKKGEKILRAMAKENGRTDQLPLNFSELVAKLASQETKTKTAMGEEAASKDSKDSQSQAFVQQLISLFRSPKMRRRTLALNFCWFATALAYYGGAFNAHNLSANLFLYTLVSGLVEIPSYLIIPPLIRILGRKAIFSASFFITAAALFLSLFFEPGSFLVISMAWIGCFCVGGGYSLIYLYGAEVMPTSVRSCGMSMAAVVGRGGSLAALYATDLLGQYAKMAPTMVLVGICLTAGFVALLLPETRNQKLPETVDDVENS